MQYRDVIGADTRAVGDESAREIEAKVCSYDVGPDTYNTTWTPGCFTRGLQEALPAVCWSHQHDNVIGSVTSYEDRPDGLYMRMRLADFDAVPEARKAYSLIKDGHIRGWSFGFADGVTEPDERHDGALAFRSAQIYEISPVLRASVPLTRTVNVRAADTTTEASDESELVVAIANGLRSASGDIRSITLVINDDGTVSGAGYSMDGAQLHEGDTPETGVGDDPDQDSGQLASAIDAACDAATALLRSVDTTSLPPEVQQALALFDAAGVAADELLDALGIDDPDDDNRAADTDEGRAAKDAQKPYGDVTYADPGYQDDKKKRYPLDTAEHVKAALSYIGQDSNAAKYSAADLAKVKAAINAAAKKLGVGDRSEVDELEETRAALELLTLR